MNWFEIFKRLGLGKNSGAIYSYILGSNKPAIIFHIAKELNLSRSEVYRNLEILLDKKFIEKVSLGKRSGYLVSDVDIVKQEFYKVQDKTNQFIEKSFKDSGKYLPKQLEYFYGPSGIQQVFDDVIKRTPKGETFYRYTSEKDLEKVNSYLSKNYRLDRDKKKLERLVISNPISGSKKKSRLERFVKFIPPTEDLFDQNIIQIIYADSLAFINLNKEEAYILRDKNLATFQSVIFKQLYKKLGRQ